MSKPRKLSRTGEIWEEAAERVTLRPLTRTRCEKFVLLAAFLASIGVGAGIAWVVKQRLASSQLEATRPLQTHVFKVHLDEANLDRGGR